MEDIHIQLIQINMICAVIGVCTGMLEEGALLGLVVAHDGSEGGASVPLDHGKVDVGIFAHFLQHEFALGIITGKAGCIQG